MGDPTKDLVSPWHPIQDPIQQKTLGKLIEECGELISAAARCSIQGVDESEPMSGKPNRQWLQEEIADVLANCALVIDLYQLDRYALDARLDRKMANLRRWHAGA